MWIIDVSFYHSKVDWMQAIHSLEKNARIIRLWWILARKFSQERKESLYSQGPGRLSFLPYLPYSYVCAIIFIYPNCYFQDNIHRSNPIFKE